MIGENDKSMLERFKEWLGADFVLPKIKFTRKPKPLPKLPVKSVNLKKEESDALQECRKALDAGKPIYVAANNSLGARLTLENTFYKCGRNKQDIKVLHEGWEDGVYVIEAMDSYVSPEYTYFN